MPASRVGYQRFLRRFSLGALSSLLSNGRNIVLLPVLTRGLGPESYGAWAQGLALVDLLSTVSLLSLNMALTRFISEGSDQRQAARGLWSCVTATAAVGSALGGLAWMLGPWTARTFLQDDAYGSMFQCAAILVPVTACERLLVVFFQARLQIGRHAVATAVETICYGVVVVGFLHVGGSVDALLLGIAVVRGLVFLGAAGVAAADVGPSMPRWAVLGPFLRFSAPLMLVGFFSWMTGLSDRHVVGMFHGAEAVAQYSVSYTLGMLCTLLFAPLFLVFTPTLVDLWERGEHTQLRGQVRHTFRYALFLAVPMVVGLTVLSEGIVGVVGGPEFFAGRWVVGLVAAGLLLLMLSGLVEPFVMLLHRTRVSALIYGLAAVLNLGANLLLVPHMGVTGAALGTLLAYLFQLVSFCIFVRRQGVSLDFDSLFLSKCLLSASVMAMPLLYLRPDGVLELAGAALLGGVIYAACCALLRAFSRGEWEFWRSSLAAALGGRRDG